MKITCDLDTGDKVCIDKDDSLNAYVTAFLIRENNLEIEVSWVQNGDIHSSWFPMWRIKKCGS